MQLSTSSTQRDLTFSAHSDAPLLLVEWHAWWPQFFNNISDLFRSGPEPAFISRPGVFWHDVFVQRPLPLQRFACSGFLHLALMVFVFTTGKFWFNANTVVAQDPFQSTTLSYYKVDDFLPAVKPKTKTVAHHRIAQKAEPVLAKQEIISISAHADNRQQTIINPPFPGRIIRNVPLPNLIVANLAPAPPLAALVNPKITLPDLRITPVQPPVAVPLSHAKLPDLSKSEVVQPAPDLKRLRSSEVDLASLQPPVARPVLPMPDPTVMNTIRKEVAQMEPSPPPQPSTRSLGAMAKPSGQLMALSLHPEPPSAVISIPNGSRAGEFAASPAGKPDASGKPEIKAAITDAASAPGTGAENVPTISIAGLPLNPRMGAIVAGPTALPPTMPQAPLARRQLAMNAGPAHMDFRRRAIPPYVSTYERQPEDKIFGGKRIYSMQLNMPNLTSAGGSWIIRFAELKENGISGDLSTPVVTTKVDPAYPPDLIRDRVQGTVVLYAIIRADGSVGDVKVLQGLHDQLDQNACAALERWRFRPAMKNGEAIDLEAVVQIPFKVRSSAF